MTIFKTWFKNGVGKATATNHRGGGSRIRTLPDSSSSTLTTSTESPSPSAPTVGDKESKASELDRRAPSVSLLSHYRSTASRLTTVFPPPLGLHV